MQIRAIPHFTILSGFMCFMPLLQIYLKNTSKTVQICIKHCVLKDFLVLTWSTKTQVWIFDQPAGQRSPHLSGKRTSGKQSWSWWPLTSFQTRKSLSLLISHDTYQHREIIADAILNHECLADSCPTFVKTISWLNWLHHFFTSKCFVGKATS